MAEIESIAEFIAVVEARYAEMARLCIGAVRETDEGWVWEAAGKTYTYAKDIFSDDCDDAEDMSDVRILQELVENPDGSITGKRYMFDNGGLLSMLDVRLDPDQASREDSGELVSEVHALEIEVFGVPEVSVEDEAYLLSMLVGALEA